MARIFRGYTFRTDESSDSPAARVMLLPDNQVESSATARWLRTQLPVQWKATESEGCQFMPN
jgi:hypothetical protein